jgi:acetylornithine deacetylase/succinyl-diaminopimelate desuccinylase-like protein
MPELRDALDALVRIPSVSGDGRPEAPIHEAHDLVARLFREAGAEVHSLELPGTAPVVLGEIPAPPGAPTVLMYSHYDVVPADDLEPWDSPPFEPTERGGAVYGRGTADTKSNIVAHLGALRAWDGRPPVGVRIVIEGAEEIGGGAFNADPLTHPERYAADVLVIGDSGSVAPGVPTLTTALRGMANVVVEARTIASAGHSGLYGGAAPDALLALIRALSSLHDAHGDAAVPGLRREEWTTGGDDEARFRALAGVPDGLALVGTGGLGSRIWSGPAITVIGLDAPPVATAVNAVQPYARAILNVRVHPEQDPQEAQRAVMAHLRAQRPYGVDLTVPAGAPGAGFAARTDTPAYDAARQAWAAAWGAEVVEAGSGGSIPVVNALARALPDADVLLVGTTDGEAHIHGPNERVLLSEFRNFTVAEADFLGRYAALWAGEGS